MVQLKQVNNHLNNKIMNKEYEMCIRDSPYTVEFAIFRCTLNWLLWNFDFISGCIGQVNLGALVIGLSLIHI